MTYYPDLEEINYYNKNSMQQMQKDPLYYVEQAIIDEDQRVSIEDTTVNPYNGIGKLITKFYDKSTEKDIQSEATAFLINQRQLMTAAHALYHEKLKKEPFQIKFYPGLLEYSNQFSGLSDLQGGIKVKRFYINKKYIESKLQGHTLKAQQYDYAILELEKNDIISEKKVLKFNFEYSKQNEKLKNRWVNIAGYPSFKLALQKRTQNRIFAAFYQQRVVQHAVVQSNQRLYYKISTVSGNSGCPILLKKENYYQVIGIHIAAKIGNHFQTNLENVGLPLTYVCENAGLDTKNNQIQANFNNFDKYYSLTPNKKDYLETKKLEIEKTHLMENHLKPQPPIFYKIIKKYRFRVILIIVVISGGIFCSRIPKNSISKFSKLSLQNLINQYDVKAMKQKFWNFCKLQEFWQGSQNCLEKLKAFISEYRKDL